MDPIEAGQRRPITPALLSGAALWPNRDKPGKTPLSLKALNLSASSLVEGSAKGTLVGTLEGVTEGSTLTLMDSAGDRFQLSGVAVQAGATATDYETNTSHMIIVREERPGAGNSPRDSSLPVTITNVAEQPILGTLGLSSASVPQGTAATIQISGTTAGSTLTLVGGSLPAGMSLDSLQKNIKGTPATAGTANFTLRETLVDSPNSPRDTNITLSVSAVDREAPIITSANPSGSYNEGVPVGGKLTANEPVTWSKSGADASKVTLDATSGEWSLESTDYETKTSYSWTFTASDAAKNTAQQAVAITVLNVAEKPGLGVLSLSSASATQGTAATINITGATPESTLTVQSGSLPNGMTLNSASRTITGTPSTAGSVSFVLREALTDSPNSPRDTALSLTVAEAPKAPALTDLTLGSTAVPEDREASIPILGASAGSSLSIQSGSLPSGMTLNSAARTITGVPSDPQTASFTLRETLAGAIGSPRDTRLSLIVSADTQGGEIGPVTDLTVASATQDGATLSFSKAANATAYEYRLGSVVNNGDTIKVRATSGAAPGTQVIVKLGIGGLYREWKVTVATVVAYDGVNAQLSRGPAVGIRDSKQLTIKWRGKITAPNGKAGTIWSGRLGSGSINARVTMQRLASNMINVELRNSAGAIVYSRTSTTGITTADGTVDLAFSVDLATGANHLRKNGVDMGGTPTTLANDTIHLATTSWSLHGAAMLTTGRIACEFTHLLCHTGFLDLNDPAIAGKLDAAAIGTTGQTSFGTTPLFFIEGNAAAHNGGTANRGTGGPFIMTGSVTDV